MDQKWHYQIALNEGNYTGTIVADATNNINPTASGTQTLRSTTGITGTIAAAPCAPASKQENAELRNSVNAIKKISK